MFRLACLAVGYCFGCLQTAYFITQARQQLDIRTMGSGNSGTMNVVESVGKAAGILTLCGDGLKTFGAIGVSYLLFRNKQGFALLTAWAGAGAVLGHNFPFWLHFRGGKGVAVTLAMLVFLDWKALILLLTCAALVYLACRRLIMCTMTLPLALPFVLWAHRFPWEVVYLTGALSLVMLYLHRAELRDPRKVVKDMEMRGEIVFAKKEEGLQQ